MGLMAHIDVERGPELTDHSDFFSCRGRSRPRTPENRKVVEIQDHVRHA